MRRNNSVVSVNSFRNINWRLMRELQQAIVLGAAQEHAQAQQALELFLKEHPKHEMAGQVYYRIGIGLMEQKQWPAAIAQFANVPAKNDWRDDALYRSAWCERRADNKLKAIPFYKELLEQFGEQQRTMRCWSWWSWNMRLLNSIRPSPV